MSDGQSEFEARLARIQAKSAAKRPMAAEPGLAPERMADLKTLRRNAGGVTLSDILGSIWDIPTFRYGLPILIAVVGYGAMSAFVPQGMHQAMIASVPEEERATAVTPFNAGSAALQRQAAFMETMKVIEAFETLDALETQ